VRKGAPARRLRNSCLQALETARAVSRDISLRDVVAFLYVAENEGINLKELAYACGFTHSTASRTARSMAAKGAPDALPPFLGLIDVRVSTTDMRGRTLHLTGEGRALRDALDVAILRAVPIAPGSAAGGAPTVAPALSPAPTA
jgi:DNA-binding MarR family transcriptional regulator